jgi:hypothetical protein
MCFAELKLHRLGIEYERQAFLRNRFYFFAIPASVSVTHL